MSVGVVLLRVTIKKAALLRGPPYNYSSGLPGFLLFMSIILTIPAKSLKVLIPTQGPTCLILSNMSFKIEYFLGHPNSAFPGTPVFAFFLLFMSFRNFFIDRIVFSVSHHGLIAKGIRACHVVRAFVNLIQIPLCSQK